MIAALYVERGGPYFGRDDVDPWDRARDARQYAGPHPIVAHPPCSAYSVLRHLVTSSRNASSSRNDADCAPIAVAQVRHFGGVLEQPAYSRLWWECKLPLPGGLPDAFGGFAESVNQLAWGHVARKRTWLYFVGVDRALVAATTRSGGRATHWVAGRRADPRYESNNVPPGIKVCSAALRRRTPPAFADWLIMLAATARVPA